MVSRCDRFTWGAHRRRRIPNAPNSADALLRFVPEGESWGVGLCGDIGPCAQAKKTGLWLNGDVRFTDPMLSCSKALYRVVNAPLIAPSGEFLRSRRTRDDRAIPAADRALPVAIAHMIGTIIGLVLLVALLGVPFYCARMLLPLISPIFRRD